MHVPPAALAALAQAAPTTYVFGDQRYQAALQRIVDLLGPDGICTCEGRCEGLREEAAEALRTAREALGMTVARKSDKHNPCP